MSHERSLQTDYSQMRAARRKRGFRQKAVPESKVRKGRPSLTAKITVKIMVKLGGLNDHVTESDARTTGGRT
jgi:hypothetical protein